MDYDPALDNAQLDMKKQSKEILEVELSKVCIRTPLAPGQRVLSRFCETGA